MWAVCMTSGCDNRGNPIDVGDTTITDPETGETTVTEVYCGVCEQQITRVVSVRPAPEPDATDPAEEP